MLRQIDSLCTEMLKVNSYYIQKQAAALLQICFIAALPEFVQIKLDSRAFLFPRAIDF